MTTRENWKEKYQFIEKQYNQLKRKIEEDETDDETPINKKGKFKMFILFLII
jgi:hypothetical protein